MPSGITGATITSLTNGTTANASDVMASLNSLKSNGVGNDSANIQTDGSGHIFTPQGQLRNITFLGTPFLIASNVGITSGNTNTYTCTGGSTGVPTGALGVWLNIFYTPSVAATGCAITPHGTAWVAGLYPLIGAAAGTTVVCGQILSPLSGGQIDVKAFSGNLTGLYIGIYAYAA